jgi:prepilin-type N-terminal cleavage/methylation domain-containing protein
MSQRNPGFTLTELLVVIAIIALLAALLLPALASSKMNAQQIGCLNNIHQITVAGLMYMSDSDTVFPENDPVAPGYLPGIASGWEKAIIHYGAEDQFRLCPSTIEPPSPLPTISTGGTANRAAVFADSLDPPITSSYGLNGWFYQFITFPPPPAATGGMYPDYQYQKPSSVQKTSQTPLFFDANFDDTFPMESDQAASDLYSGQPPMSTLQRGMGCCTILRHGGPTASASVPYHFPQPLPGAINMSFDDGHTELVRLKGLWQYDWHLNWNYRGPL